MRLNQKIITRIALLALPVILPICLVLIARLTFLVAGVHWENLVAAPVSVLALIFGGFAGVVLIVEKWPKS